MSESTKPNQSPDDLTKKEQADSELTEEQLNGVSGGIELDSFSFGASNSADAALKPRK